MFFTLEALQAEHGDCLVLHWGTAKASHRMLIDGGPAAVWRGALRQRLETLQGRSGQGADALPIDLLMVSHMDDDHIGGVLGLIRHLQQQQEDEEPGLVDIRALWHNAFEDLVGDPSGLASLAEVAELGAQAASTEISTSLPLGQSAAVVASISQAAKLRGAADSLGIPLNPGFGGLVRKLARARRLVPLDGLEVEILAPSSERLDALQAEWRKVMARRRAKQADAAEVAALLDNSVFNLSSIVAVARAGGRSILLTGDARSDDIEAGLDDAGLLDGAGGAHFDILKVPHHGSARNLTPEFLGRITADHYLISANGRDDNPDVAMLRMLTAARPAGGYRIHLTNPVPHALKVLRALRRTTPFQLVVRKTAATSLFIDLADALPRGLRG